MSAIKGLESKDTLHNKIFRATFHPWILSCVTKYIDHELGNNLHRPTKAKALGFISESLAYEKFPSLVHVALYLFA